MITSAIAAWTATLGLGEESQYHFASDILPHSFLWWAIIAGPILGAGAWLFRKATSTARSRVRSNWQMPVFCLLAFSLLAVLSLYFPSFRETVKDLCSWLSTMSWVSPGRRCCWR